MDTSSYRQRYQPGDLVSIVSFTGCYIDRIGMILKVPTPPSEEYEILIEGVIEMHDIFHMEVIDDENW